MPSPWLHPLERAKRILTLRLQALERAMPEQDDALKAWPGWDDYVRTCDVLARLIAAMATPAEHITRGELATRFRKGAG